MLNKERLRIASPVFKLLLCRCDETNYTSCLGNNEIKPPKEIGLNSVTKNRTPNYPNQSNLIEQRTAADAGMVLGFIWNKEEQGDGADVYPGLANTTEENSAIAGMQTEPQLATKMPRITNWFECFTQPQRPSSKTSRLQYCLLSKPLLPLQLNCLENRTTSV